MSATAAFDASKREVLRKLAEFDKSPKGSLDEPIAPLVHSLNAHPDYVTTSCCSGRIAVFASHAIASSDPANCGTHSRYRVNEGEDAIKPAKVPSKGGTWLLSEHRQVDIREFREALAPFLRNDANACQDSQQVKGQKYQQVLLKHEPFVMHVRCRHLHAAKVLLGVALELGFRESGVVLSRSGKGDNGHMLAIRTHSNTISVPLVAAGAAMPPAVLDAVLDFLLTPMNAMFRANRERTDALTVLVQSKIVASQQQPHEQQQNETRSPLLEEQPRQQQQQQTQPDVAESEELNAVVTVAQNVKRVKVAMEKQAMFDKARRVAPVRTVTAVAQNASNTPTTAPAPLFAIPLTFEAARALRARCSWARCESGEGIMVGSWTEERVAEDHLDSATGIDGKNAGEPKVALGTWRMLLTECRPARVPVRPSKVAMLRGAGAAQTKARSPKKDCGGNNQAVICASKPEKGNGAAARAAIVDYMLRSRREAAAARQAATKQGDTHGIESELEVLLASANLPRRWELVGSVVMVPPATLRPTTLRQFKQWCQADGTAVPEATATATSGSDSGVGTDSEYDDWSLGLWHVLSNALRGNRVARHSEIDTGRMRKSRIRMLWGAEGQRDGNKRDGSTVSSMVSVRENGLVYTFDLTKTMFSSGNVSEKQRTARFACDGQTVIDLFAGIGYWVLPLLKHANAAHVHACELNPDSVQALTANVHANGVAERCTVHAGDNQETAPALGRIADRVMLGLIPSSEAAWPLAVAALKDTGGWLHVHMNVSAAKAEREAFVTKLLSTLEALAHRRDAGHTGDAKWVARCEHIERVKSYAPRVDHIVVDVFLGPQSAKS